MKVETLGSTQRARSQIEKCQPFRKTATLPGGLYEEHKRCNRPNCRCTAGGDSLHGPYLYRRWSEGGRLRSQYVKAVDADHVRAGLAAWQRLHPPARSTRDALGELRRLIRGLEV